MSKRKFMKDSDEDAQDQDYQDHQDSDEDCEPSSGEIFQGRPYVLSLRVTRSRSTLNASDPQNRDDEEVQGQIRDGGDDTTREDNTSEATLQNAPQPPKCGKTKYCGVKSPRIAKPKKLKRETGRFFCVICGSNFTRAASVNYHFPGCVEKYGNPLGNCWDDHPSCAPRRARKDALADDPSPPVQGSASKKRCIQTLSSGPSTANPSGGNDMHQPRQTSHASALPMGPRVTRSRTTQRTSETQPNSDVHGTRTSSKSMQRASKPIKPRPKPTQSLPDKKQHTSNPSGKRKPRTQSKKASDSGEKTNVQRFGIDGSLPPLSDLDAIFHDLVSNAFKETPLEHAMETLPEKQIHIATMCSGTESPLLALEKIQKDLELRGKPMLNIKHLFSAEIVPFKQAYIERNFHPDRLFRDIREMAEGGQATTAYGALTDVPSDVDILVAGFSCVDFSRLNKNTKKLTDTGESGDTFRAILGYAKQYRPAIIILENVDGAPWDLIQAIWQNDRESVQEHCKKVDGGIDPNELELDTFWDEDDPAYSADYQRVDAKHYYIPQTRTRRYMICLDRLRFPSPDQADEAVQKWKQYMVALRRTASVSFEAFLLPEDDPRLQYAKDEMSKTGKPRRERDWEVCRGRHEEYRTIENLGISRPILNWTNDGSAKASSYLWTDWTLSQVERVWDSIEICYLRNAARGFDSFFKTRVWELSQNIDRFTDGARPGVINCLTPTGQPFLSVRGGPITGLEAISLQGLPIDVLLLTRESQRELIDLAGNAMTSTVVGAALLSALAVSHTILTRTKEPVNQTLHDLGHNLEGMRDSELGQKQVLGFDGSSDSSLEELCKMAKASVRLCHCEGQSLTAPALIRICKCCHHHCCEKCGNMPKHDYELLGGNGAPVRTEPQEFRRRLRYAIPTRLEIDGFSSETLEVFAQLFPDGSKQDWRLFSEAILLASEQEYRYESARRSHCWTITYNATHSRLELVFDQEEVYWLLYGKPGQTETGNSRVRTLLDHPLARLTVRGTTMRGESTKAESMLKGTWEICLPIAHTFPITVTPQGELTDSWEKKLGLQGEKFIDKQVYTSLHVARTSVPAAELALDHDICGDYDLLDNCGTACSSLHKKRSTTDGHDAPPLFLFLDADRMGLPNHDSFVFSTEIQRLEYGESRYITAKVESEWRPPCKGSDPRTDCAVSTQAECTVSSRWSPCPIFLRPHKELEEASSRFPNSEISIPVFGTDQHLSQSSADDVYGCLHETATTALLSCEIPGQVVDSVGWRVGHWTTIDQNSGREIAAAFAWLFARVKDLGDFEGGWRSLGPCPSGYRKCLTCAPEPPRIMWTCSRSANEDKIIPYEDGREAGNFERKIKARPAPFLVQTYIDDDEKRTGRLLVGLNLPTLVHRALARLGNIADSDDIEMDWRLDTGFEAPTRYKLKELTLPNNELASQAEYDFPTGEQLRPEQKRSLQWMIGQEADEMVFYEEEIEEATLSQLSWRAEARVRRVRTVRGGILADEVGYGKTATTLALIHAQEESAKEYASNKNAGCISVKATLILVPPHLVHQWKGQAHKFLGISSNDDKILVIEDLTDLARISVQRIKQATIVLTSWRVLSSPAYMTRMSHFAALPEGPSSGERETDVWLTRACGNIKKHMGELVSEQHSPVDFAAVLKLRLKAAHTDKDIIRDVPTQRLKGAKYTTWNPAECVTPKDPSPKEQDLEKFFKHMTREGCTDLNSMTGILLHMFDFHRIVVDEYTYVDKSQQAGKLSKFIATINARSRWVLSGTPSIQDFGDVRNLASFLAYNLGVVDDAAGVLKGAAIRHIRDDRTAAEQFRAYGYSHTAAWHISRQAHAQKFLDKFASKNVAEIGLIRCMTDLRPHCLGAAETIVNAELQQQLQSTEMKIVLRGKSKNDNDRLRRYQDLLQDCQTASECLLRACSYFELVDTRSAESQLSGDAMDVDVEDVEDEDDFLDEEYEKFSFPTTELFGACETMISIREKQMRALVAELEYNLLHAAWLEQQCGRATAPEYQGSHYRQWKSEIELIGLRDPTATSDLRYYLIAALEKVDANTEEIYYRDPPTAEDLKREKKAADELKKQAKDKRTADRRLKKASEGNQSRKASRMSKATACPDEDPDEDSAEMVVGDSESIQAGDMDPNMAPNPADPKPNKIRKDDFKKYASVLRGLTGHLRSLVAELTSRTRSLRFARGAEELSQWYTDLSKPPTCRACGKIVLDHDSISINIRCGHSTCQDCIQTTHLAICAVDGCCEGSDPYRLRKGVDLVGDGETWTRGSRLGHIIELINSLPKDEQVLLFVQFEDVMLKMASGLEEANISCYALSQKAGHQIVDMMNDFQDNQGKNKKKVLLLNPSNETASGINLTNANHIIFASPLLTKTQQSYNASMTQCIGRAKRYGQQKTVHVYRFFALRTIDVDILQEREVKTLVKKKDLKGKRAERRGIDRGKPSGESSGEWLLVTGNAFDDALEAGWGSGYDFKSDPTEDE